MVDRPVGARWTLVLLTVAVLLGTFIRWSYVDNTPPALRSHDFQGHVDYIAFVLEHARIPSQSQGFQGYQPPLYYFLAAPLAAPATEGGTLNIGALQQLSLGISVLTLGAALWCGWLLFSGRRAELSVYALVMATFPGLVYSASRVSNDGLVQLMLFGALGLLIRWWQTRKDRWWMLCAGLTGLGVLTKSSGLLMVPIALGCLWMRPDLTRRARLRLAALGAGIVTAVSGWLIAIRLVVDKTTAVVPNTAYLPPELSLSSDIRCFLVFNPVRILEHPFGNRLESLQQIQGFWEFYFRSAFFGEFPFDPALRNLGWLILLLALLVLPLMGLGLYRVLRHQRAASAHIWVPFLSLLGTHATYRLVAPFTPSQDFRYTSLVLVPAVWLVLEGAGRLPGPLRCLSLGVVAVLAILCGDFLLALS